MTTILATLIALAVLILAARWLWRIRLLLAAVAAVVVLAALLPARCYPDTPAVAPAGTHTEVTP